jgi:hypothetical protein
VPLRGEATEDRRTRWLHGEMVSKHVASDSLGVELPYVSRHQSFRRHNCEHLVQDVHDKVIIGLSASYFLHKAVQSKYFFGD